MKALNGWQRIWIVISVLTLIPTVLLAVSNMPDAESTNRTFADKLIQKSLELSEFKGYGVLDIRSAYRDMTDEEFIERVITKHGKKMDEAGISYKNLVTEHADTLRDLKKTQIILVTQYLSAWASILGVLYAFGWSVGWIRQGFRKSE